MSRHENSNQFKDGLLMDLHPMQAPNTVLTDCLNGTFITYNGNEYSLQNDMGNFKLKNCRLRPGYLPIGSTSYADTIYLLSYNPIEDKIEVGSYPSPVQYNDSSDIKYHQIPGILEGYLMTLQKSTETQDMLTDYLVNQSDLKNNITSITFDGDKFRLKSGDEYAIRVENTNLCEFEKFDYEVIFDSGKKQKFTPELQSINGGSGTTPVPWNTPGNIKITNHLFEFNQNSNKIVAKRTFKDRVELDILYEAFVVDPDFNNILFDSLLENKITVDCSIEIPDWHKEGSGKIKRKAVKSWLDTYKKIEYLFTFTIPSKQVTGGDGKTVIEFPNYVDITITPIFKTTVVLPSSESNKEVAFDIIQDEHLVNLHIDLENIELSEIGGSDFYWYVNDDITWLCANYVDMDEYHPYYKIWKIDSDNNVVSETNDDGPDMVDGWVRINNNEKPGVFKIDISDKKDKILAISFCYKEELEIPKEDWSKYKDDWCDITGQLSDNLDICKRQCDDIVTKIVYIYNPEKMEDLWIDYCSVILNDGDKENDGLTYGSRFDLIPFENIYKDHLNCLSYNVTSTGTVDSIYNSDNITLQEFGIIHDFGAEEGEFYKYFSRFLDSEKKAQIQQETNAGKRTWFPSIVEKAPESYRSDQCFEIPRNATLKLDSIPNIEQFGEISADTIKKGIEIKYSDRKDLLRESKTLNWNTVNPISLWNKVKGEVQQKGDLFYFADSVQYEEFKPAGTNRFDVVTLDEDGKKKSGFVVDCQVNEQWYQWKSLDIQNYRAIRMGYPETSHDIGESVPCRQMDFSGLGQNNLLQSFKKRKLAGLCNYIGNFHQLIRKNLDSKVDAWWITFYATTFYRDKAQRPSFTLNSGEPILYPDWRKWKDGEGKRKEKHVTASRDLLALPVFDKKQNDDEKPYQWGSKLNPINPTEVLEMTEDYECWVKVSGSQQHSTPVKKGDPKEISGIGLIGTSYDRRWYKAWISNWDKDPNDPKCYFSPHCQTKIVPGISWLGQSSEPSWCGQLFFKITIPDALINQFVTYKNAFVEFEFENIPKSKTFNFGHRDVWTQWQDTEIDDYFAKLNEICDNDFKYIGEQHPIFKSFVWAGSRVSDRIKNWPVAGVFPTVEDIVSDDVFDRAVYDNMPPWKNIYVDGEGKPYLTDINPDSLMYVCKNNKKQVFGYFPYVAC